MHAAELLTTNLLSPIVLAFLLGAIAVGLRSDLRVPADVGSMLSIYLLLAIGLKGGSALRDAELGEVLAPIVATLALGLVVPLLAYGILRARGAFSVVDAAAMAAHYGSVSAVTFAAGMVFVEEAGTPAEGFLPALVAVLEVPAIVVGLLLARRAPAGAKGEGGWSAALAEIFAGRSVVLLVGGMAIGAASLPANLARVEPFFVGLFPGALVLFLLDMGMVAARRVPDLRAGGLPLLAFALLFPLLSGTLGVLGGVASGMSVGGVAVLGAMSASASYIAAPAALRIALPEANLGCCLTAAITITFPFNLAVGIPLFHALAVRLA